MIRGVLVVKDEEPKVVSVQNGSYREYVKIINGALSDKEKEVATADSIDSFGVDVRNVVGYVESMSALYPYERNRQWYGPALFFEYNDEGESVDMSDENIETITNMFSLENQIISPSTYVNEFLDKYAKSEMHNASHGFVHTILDTMDAVTFLKQASRPEDVRYVEGVLKEIEMTAFTQGLDVSDVLTSYLKEINLFLFEQSASKTMSFYEGL